ncbi:hypothetical protein STEG23_012580 [Scotinomys teguina]
MDNFLGTLFHFTDAAFDCASVQGHSAYNVQETVSDTTVATFPASEEKPRAPDAPRKATLTLNISHTDPEH